MKKVLKKGLKIFGITILLLLVAIVLIPVFFGSQIKEAVKDYINEEINAEVYFEDIGISVFNNFPNITVTLDEFGIAGKEEFKGDTLVDVNHFGVVVDLFSVFGDKYKVKKITLDEPRIHAKVLKTGKPNWDIIKPSDEVEAEPETAEEDTSSAGSLALELSAYSITKGHIIYDDKFGDIYAEIVNLNHKGSGDFSDDNYDFDTYTSADEVTVRMEGTNYLNKSRIDADLTLGINTAESMYTLKDNRIGLNALNLHFDGWLKMAGDDISMDMKFGTNENTFSSILSMVPGMYTEDFDDIDTDGTFALDGSVKGTYNEKKIPGFNVHLGVENGRFHYPDLPEEVKDINFDVKVDCPDGNLDKLKVNMPKFHAQFGEAPVDMRCILTNVTSPNIGVDASAKASINLANLGKMFPMEGQTMKGLFTVDGTAKGNVNAEAGTFPVVNAIMKLENGYYKNADFPSALDKMSMSAEMKNGSPDMVATTLDVTNFHTEIDGAPIDATLKVKNFDDPNYDLSVKGSLDLQKLNKIYPMEGTTMAGLVNLDLTTSGTVSAIENEQYLDLPTTGSMSMKSLNYVSEDFPQGMAVSDGQITFTPSQLQIVKFAGKLGKSPVSITGSLNNYLAYVMMPDQKIKGNMSLVSPKFDVNEWMVEDPDEAPSAEAAEAPAEDVPMEVFEVPGDIDFTFDCKIAKVFYDNLTLNDLHGLVIMQNQEVRFQNLAFNTLGGSMRLAGGYNTRDITKPEVDMTLNLTNVDIKKTYEAFAIVQAVAPAAKFVNGRLNTSATMKSTLLGDMSPDYSSLTSDGDIIIDQGVLKGFKAMDMVADKIKLAKLREVKLADTKIFFEVKNGRIHVEPFDVPIGSGNMQVVGSNGIDQTMKYNLDFDIPAGVAGQAAMNAVSGLLGSGADAKSDGNLRAAIGLGGTVDKPKITYVKSSSTDAIAEALDDKIEDVKEEVEEKIEDVKEEVEEKIEDVKEEIEDKIDEAKEEARKKADKILKDAEAAAAKIRAEGKKAADKVRTESEANAKKTEKSAKNPIEKAAKKKAADLIRKQGKEKAAKLEKEANQKADKVLSDARKKANELLK